MPEKIPEKRSVVWPKRHAYSLEKWDKIVEKTEAGEDFSSKRVWHGFSDLIVWTACGYCEELILFGCCDNCMLHQRKIIWEGKEIPICSSSLISISVASNFVNEMISSNPDREKAVQLAKIVRDEIAKDKPE